MKWLCKKKKKHFKIKVRRLEFVTVHLDLSLSSRVIIYKKN